MNAIKGSRSAHVRWRDAGLTLMIITAAVGVCLLMRLMDDGDIYVSMIFQLAVLLVARATDGYFWGIFASVLSVFAVNYVFTYPYWAFNFTISGYPVTFISMLVVSVLTSAMTTQIKQQEKVRRAAERERIRGDLLRAISHDLRTPLTSIVGASSAILENDEQIDAARRREMMGEIVEDAQWLIRMVENLLSITRIDGAVRRIRKLPEPVEEVVGEAVYKFNKHYPRSEVNVRVPDELLMVPMDALLIEQVLINLLENAVRHGRTTRNVSLCVRRTGDEALFEVADDGQGIPKELLGNLFEGGYAAGDRATDASRGMGIGLSVCMSIIVAHGGRMDAENRPEGGALFWFALPLMEEYEQQADGFDRRG
ncbi:DUF4118 domain-containing protein [Bacillota bacterium Meth-B3]|nr:DUF4118 domain-containing protein [Christensenellaceae bacterium]